MRSVSLLGYIITFIVTTPNRQNLFGGIRRNSLKSVLSIKCNSNAILFVLSTKICDQNRWEQTGVVLPIRFPNFSTIL